MLMLALVLPGPECLAMPVLFCHFNSKDGDLRLLT